MNRFLTGMLLLLGLLGNAQEPLLRWDFEGPSPYVDKIQSKNLNYQTYKCPSSIEAENGNRFLSLGGIECLLQVNGLSQAQDRFSMSFNFKGSYFSYISFPAQNFKFVFDYDYFQFSTVTVSNGQQSVDEWIVRLNGNNVPSYSDIADNNWHSLVLRADAKSGVKEIILDGKKYSGLKKTNRSADRFIFSDADGIKRLWSLDDLQFYNQFLTDESINNLQSQFLNRFPREELSAIAAGDANAKSAIDLKEFAPGYQSYSTGLLEQLRSFPLPRFVSGKNLNRNFSWLDISYLHRQYNYPLVKGFGRSEAKYAAAIVEEMARNWNYYIEMPTLRMPEAEAKKRYSSPNFIEGAIVDLSNRNPDLPVSTVMIQAAINPSHYGFNSSRALVYSQNLPDEYYLRDANGKPVLYNNKKWLSPLMPLDIIENDGKVAGKYISVVNGFLKNPIQYINENGEIYGHIRPLELWNKDPKVAKLFQELKMSNADFNGWFQNRIDSTYKAQLLLQSGNPDARFSMYDLSASASDYWPSYRSRININSKFNGAYRSTPAFYPATPGNWVIGDGPFMGYGMVAEGRKVELSLGVKRFAPFVAAGWSDEETNIRPAQWLSLLKAMVMLGADFFHAGYFNITDEKGLWPNGFGPYDPSGYAYQVVMPSYAQALFPRVEQYIDKGQLIEGNYTDSKKIYRIQGFSENQLILARKINSNYILYGSIQPNSNLRGSIPDSVVTQITIDGKKIKMPIRRQGSMYELKIGSDTTFVQLDGWHQKEHPSYWSKQALIEAELGDLSGGKIKTDYAGNLDFSRFTSYVSFGDAKTKLNISVPLRTSGKYRILVRAKARSSNGILTGLISNKNERRSVRINSNNWREYTLVPSVVLLGQKRSDEYLHTINLSAQGNIDIDYIKVIPL